MTEFGHIKISRKAFKRDVLWKQKREYSPWEAWVWMIQEAAWGDIVRTISGSPVELQRGEIVASVRFLAEAWSWKRSRVHEFLRWMVDKKRIIGQRETRWGTVYLLVNYEKYQGGNRTEERTPTGQQPDKVKAVKSNPSSSTTSSACAGDDEVSTAKSEMWAEFESRAVNIEPAELGKARAIVRGIIEGDTVTAWIKPDGERVEWEDRPRIFRLSLDERTATGGKLHNVMRLIVIPREFDPFEQVKSADRKREYRNELPREHRNGPSTDGFEQAMDNRKARREDADRALSEWAQRVSEAMRFESDEARAELSKAAQEAIGKAGLQMLRTPEMKRKAIEAKMLELYGEKIGDKQPPLAA